MVAGRCCQPDHMVIVRTFRHRQALLFSSLRLPLDPPNGMETLGAGSPYEIPWGHTGSISDVALHYSIDNGGSWIPIISRTVNDHQRDWVIPAENSTTCLVRIMEAGTGDPVDISDGVFTITPEAPAANIALTSPNGGEVLLGGGGFPITSQWA